MDQANGANTPVLLNRASLAEQCVLTESEKQQRDEFAKKKLKSQKKEAKSEDKDDEKRKRDDKDEDEEKGDKEKDKRDMTALVVSSSLSRRKSPSSLNFYECVKFCQPFKMHAKSNMNGFLVPTRSLFAPGEHMTYMCHDGYAVEIPVIDVSVNSTLNETTNATETGSNIQKKISNINTFVCSMNGTWHLLLSQANTNKESMLVSSNEITNLPRCSNLRDLLRNNDDSNQVEEEEATVFKSGASLTSREDLWLPTNDQLIYTELNIRSLCLMLAVGGILMIFLVLSVLALKFYKVRRESILYQSYQPQLDNQPFDSIVNSTASNTSISEYTRSVNLAIPSPNISSLTPLIGHVCAQNSETSSSNHQHSHFQSCLVPPVIPRSMPLPTTVAASISLENQLVSSTSLQLPSYEEAVLQQQQQQNDLSVNNGMN
jgi:hypothetical protein